MDGPDIISGAITRPERVTLRYFVVKNVEAVVALQVAAMVVVVHEGITG